MATKLGERLVEQGKISVQQLDFALKYQLQTQGRLGEVLVQLGLTDEETVLDALLERVPPAAQAPAGPGHAPTSASVEALAAKIDAATVVLVPCNLARKLRVIPVRLNPPGNELVLAMADPTNVQAVQEVQFLLNRKVIPVKVPDADLDQLYPLFYPEFQAVTDQERKHFRQSQGLQKALASLTETNARQVVDGVLVKAFALGASDLHLEPGPLTARLAARIAGTMQELGELNRPQYQLLLNRFKQLAGLETGVSDRAQGGRIKVASPDDKREIELRVHLQPTHDGQRLVVHISDKARELLDLENLGLGMLELHALRRCLFQPRGLILLAAPAHSGVTTTLYAMLAAINDGSRAILTLEDPVEYAMERISRIQVGFGEGRGFVANLREAGRQDLDVLVLSNIPDTETLALAMDAALSRQLVIACIYAEDVAHALQHLLEMEVNPTKLARVLRTVVSQRLVSKLCPSCKLRAHPEAKDLLRIGLKPEEVQSYVFMEASGCPQCQHTGHAGQTGIFEVLKVTELVRERIVRRPNLATLRHQLHRDGVVSLKEAALEKAKMGAISIQELLRVLSTFGG